jgi:AcrR family transcriptional regulator
MANDENKPIEPRGAALALILAAERLIAERGSDVVTSRDITEAAGVANTSAINYHFGSREALLFAVFEYRVSVVNAHRRAYLDKLADSDRLLDQRSLVEAMIYPLSEQLVARPDGNHYLRFLERIRRERVRDMMIWARDSGLPVSLSDQTPSWGTDTAVPQLVSDMAALLDSWVEVEQHIARTLAWLPSTVANFRVQMLREHTVSGLTSIEEMLELRATLPAEVPSQIEMLVDAGVAMLTGPISPGLMATLGLTGQG